MEGDKFSTGHTWARWGVIDKVQLSSRVVSAGSPKELIDSMHKILPTFKQTEPFHTEIRFRSETPQHQDPDVGANPPQQNLG